MAVLKSRKNINNKKPWAKRYGTANSFFFFPPFYLKFLEQKITKLKKPITGVNLKKRNTRFFFLINYLKTLNNTSNQINQIDDLTKSTTKNSQKFLLSIQTLN